MNEVEARAALERLIERRGESYASISRLLGRNAAYIQQHIRRGSPRRLEEADRRKLARYFGVDDSELGGPASPVSDFLMVPKLAVQASAGPGTFVEGEAPIAQFGFDRRWLSRITSGRLDQLSIIQVSGDSMSPTLADGDDILIDRADAAPRLRDGIYALRRDDTLMVKRLSLNPFSSLLTIASDNPAYPTWADCPPDGVDLIGRVVWAGRRLA
ncbi:helix-turn-helix transcriptional regulator [Sphingomonas koreensis]|uniref:Helix-turn-helix transcriptional regulator n=1 Tax=Sphingomonas koreensis TaxID=93064 RepID=A0A430FYW6_9SPHN|nr:S24 family peptidase [Sphingomonas koreensis]RSY78059.1 helix-turn-helix transcriptional regulator [Sphingomonas koreensis]